MIGRLILKTRQTFQHGLTTAWYRDIVRKRILNTAPVEAGDTSVCEIHVLTSQTDWLNLIWALKSFYHASGRRYGLCIHDDGTLTDETRGILTRHFPHARVLNRKTSEQQVLESLAKHPKCHEFRTTNCLSPKVFDFRHFLNAERMLLLDSDVLFFHEQQNCLDESKIRITKKTV